MTEDFGEKTLQAFLRDLPELYRERPGEFVAYRGEERIGTGKVKHLLYQSCQQRGYVLDEVVVFCIEPLETEMVIGPLLDWSEEQCEPPRTDERGQQALQAFLRDLPELHRERPGEFVAYRGEERIGTGKVKHLLSQSCQQRGYVLDEVVVFCIEPLETEMVIGPLVY